MGKLSVRLWAVSYTWRYGSREYGKTLQKCGIQINSLKVFARRACHFSAICLSMPPAMVFITIIAYRLLILPLHAANNRLLVLVRIRMSSAALSSLYDSLSHPRPCSFQFAVLYLPYFWNSQSLLSSGQTWRVFSHREMQWKWKACYNMISILMNPYWRLWLTLQIPQATVHSSLVADAWFAW